MAAKKPMKKPVKRVRRFQEGGETADKAAGLAASNMDPRMGFFERLRMGNIDQEGSEAYNRLGAGRGRGERVALSELAGMTASNNAMPVNAMPVKNAEDGTAQNLRIANAQGAREMDEEMYQRAAREGKVVDSADMNRDYTPIAKPAAAAQIAAIIAKPAKRIPATANKVGIADARGAREADEEMYQRARREGTSATRAASAAAAPATSAATTRVERQANIDQAFKPPSAENTQKGLEAGTLGAGLAGGAALAALLSGAVYKGRKMYKAGQAAKEASRVGAEKRAILKKQTEEGIDANLLAEFQGLASSAAKQSKKKGGMVKKMAHGGSVKSPVSTASKRGDGIALRGKTRGKIY